MKDLMKAQDAEEAEREEKLRRNREVDVKRFDMLRGQIGGDGLARNLRGSQKTFASLEVRRPDKHDFYMNRSQKERFKKAVKTRADITRSYI